MTDGFSRLVSYWGSGDGPRPTVVVTELCWIERVAAVRLALAVIVSKRHPAEAVVCKEMTYLAKISKIRFAGLLSYGTLVADT